MCPIVTNVEHHGNSKGTGNRRKNKTRQNELRQVSKHGNHNILGHDVRFIVWKKKGNKRNGRQSNEPVQIIEESVHESRNQVGDDVTCSASKNVELSCILQPRAQIACAAGKNRSTSPAIYFEMTNMEVEHVLAKRRALAWAISCSNKKYEEVMWRVWKITVASTASWKRA